MSDAGGIGALAKQMQRQARALERLVEQLANASLPLAMSKVRAARELDCSVTTLNRLINSGAIKLTKHGKVPASELLRFAMVEGRPAPVEKTHRHRNRIEAEKLRQWRVP